MLLLMSNMAMCSVDLPQLNLLVFQQYILDAFKVSCQVGIIYTDYTKAFNKIDHNKLTAKLYHLRLRNPIYSWIISFLTCRYQYIKLKRYNSNMNKVTSGIPQGSHFAPFIFNIYGNDINLVNSNLFLFTDDIRLLRIVRSQRDIELLQNDFDNFGNWCDTNTLHLNNYFFEKKLPFIKKKYYLNGAELD